MYLHSSQHSGEFYSILDIWSTRRRLDYLLSLHGRGNFPRTSLSATLPFTSTIYRSSFPSVLQASQLYIAQGSSLLHLAMDSVANPPSPDFHIQVYWLLRVFLIKSVFYIFSCTHLAHISPLFKNLYF